MLILNMMFKCLECGLVFSERDAITVQSNIPCPECGCKLQLLLCPYCAGWDFYSKLDMHNVMRQIRREKLLRARYV